MSDTNEPDAVRIARKILTTCEAGREWTLATYVVEHHEAREQARRDGAECPRCHRNDLTVATLPSHRAQCMSHTDEEYDEIAASKAEIVVTYRVGRHYGIHVYNGDRPVATFHDAAEARRFVDAANVNGVDMSTLLFCSVRYALGRMTYIVADVCRIVRENATALSAQDRANIVHDIGQAESLGMDFHERRWRELAAWLAEGEL